MTAPDVFSVPRRFDMATLLVAMTGFSLLFAFMYLIEPVTKSGAAGMAAISGLFIAVTIGQAAVIKRGDPRMASIIAGGIYWFIAAAVLASTLGPHRFDGCILTVAVLFGPVSGYLAGTLVGGVFLIAYHLREHGFLRNGRQKPTPPTTPPGTTASITPPMLISRTKAPLPHKAVRRTGVVAIPAPVARAHAAFFESESGGLAIPVTRPVALRPASRNTTR